MHMMLILLMTLCTICAYPGEILKENISRASRGDWLTLSFDKNYTYFRVQNKEAETVDLEEVSISCKNFSCQKLSFAEWAKRGFPLKASHVVYKIDLKSGRFLQIASRTDHTSLSVNQGNAFLTTLLNLNLKKIPDSQRRRVGPPVFGSGPVDTRKVWQPRLVFQGTVVQGVNFDAFTALWPHDGSDLSGKFVEIYLPQEGQKYPSYFPYYMEISGMIGKAKLHIVDSGTERDAMPH
ncbi:hypothetical protein [Estrella lausannensis]|uniref:Conserved putative secreted protein n=1 Tax=Estrella lausannensis TaxID=483423 RepID=A0A0H5DQ72_9BACT|nr:hypothetical protein [Estrella lausannensis]CRX38642.1 Conserved putative secreted protein [Estrella lausannensis]